MKIQTTDARTFELMQGSDRVGQIIYNGPFSYKAKLVVANTWYSIVPIGIFNTFFSVRRNDAEIAKMQMNWKGQITIDLLNNHDFLLTATGWFANNYQVKDADNKTIMSLAAKFNWSKFIYNYDISITNKQEDILLVLLATYSANYYISAMAGS